MPVVDELSRAAHAARLGDQQALEQFVRRSYPEVWRLCAALVDEGAAEDLAQETFTRATAALRRFRGEASARTWILAIARRTCMDELRRRYRQGRRAGQLAATVAPSAAAPDPSGEVETRELLVHLDPDRRAAFVLTQLFRLSYEEAAAVCGCPPGTIRSRVARARDDLIGLIGHDQTSRRIPHR
jgi:RNA polymerase sigma-70 factor (ECF subfamily)